MDLDSMVTEMKHTDTLRVIDSPKVYSSRMKNLQELRKNRTFCDVVLQVENMDIYAHRCVLACASPYFFELFTADHDIKSATEDKLIYKLNGVFGYNSLESLITYAYTGELEVDSSEIKSVYITSCKLKMDEISRACGEHLIGTFTPENCLQMRAIHGVSGDEHLVSAIDNYIQQQLDLSQLTQEAHDISKIMVNIIHGSKDEAAIMTRALCNLTFEWVKKQMDEEDVTLEELSEKTHLLYLNSDNSLHDCSDMESGAANDSEIIQDYKKISRKTSQPSIKARRKPIGAPQPAKPRMMLFSRSVSDENDSQERDWKLVAHSKVADNSMVAIVVLDNIVTVLSIQQQFNILPPNSDVLSHRSSVDKVDNYTSMPVMSSPKCACGVGTLSGKLLVCGGYDRGECLSVVEGYNPETNSWESLPNMNQSRGRFDLTVLEGKAFAVGGCNGAKELDSVEMLDETLSEWKMLKSLPLARSNTAVCNLNGHVYCIGGWNGQFGIRRCDRYDPKTDTWSTIDSLHEGRYQAGVASLNGKIYAVGGCNSWNCLNSVEVYDPLLEVWRSAPVINTPRRGCGVAVFNDLLYVVGGSDGSHSLCTTEIFDPETNCWFSGPSMSSCRANVSVSVLNNRLYAVGGFSGKNFLNSIEYLDLQTNEWTTFTPKPSMFGNNNNNNTDYGKNTIEGELNSFHETPLRSRSNGHYSSSSSDDQNIVDHFPDSRHQNGFKKSEPINVSNGKDSHLADFNGVSHQDTDSIEF